MPHTKTIRLTSYGPIVAGYTSPWEDVWVRYHIGKKKIVEEGPCILSGYDLRSDIRLQEQMMKDHPSEWRDGQVEDLKRIQDEFAAGTPIAFLGGFDPNDRLPNIYVNVEEIDKKVVEDVVTYWLRKKKVLNSQPRFRWNKLKGLDYIQPISAMGD